MAPRSIHRLEQTVIHAGGVVAGQRYANTKKRRPVVGTMFGDAPHRRGFEEGEDVTGYKLEELGLCSLLHKI